jgi:high-affinity Fe2+/Pb2+ permease
VQGQLAGLLLPAVITGLGSPSPEASLIAAWYLVLTVVALGFAYRDRGVRRATGYFIIGSYLVFLGSLVATARSHAPSLGLALVPLLMVTITACAVLSRRPGRSERG